MDGVLLQRLYGYLSNQNVLLFTTCTSELARLMLSRDADLADRFPMVMTAPDFNVEQALLLKRFAQQDLFQKVARAFQIPTGHPRKLLGSEPGPEEGACAREDHFLISKAVVPVLP
jgi:hypothetical protein